MQTNRLNLRSVVVIAICLVATTMFSGCDKGKGEPNENESSLVIDAKIVNGDDYSGITSVKMEIQAIERHSPTLSYWTWNELANVKYENNILKLNFPENVPDEYLGEYLWYGQTTGSLPWFSDYPEHTFPEGVIINEPDAKVGIITIKGYDSVGTHVGSFVFNDYNYWYAEYIYADRSFTVKGITKHGLVFDCSFKKGWNIRYFTPLEGGKFTTQKPAGINFEWRYDQLMLL